MSSYILRGKDIDFGNLEHKLQEGSISILGNGISSLDCNNLEFEANSNVKIYAHGRRENLKDLHFLIPPEMLEVYAKIGMDYIHYLSLCKFKGQYSSPSFNDLSRMSHGKATNFVLASCYGGTAINDVFFLPEGSTLITLDTTDHTLMSGLGEEMIIRSKDFDYPDNPFIQYIFYILNNPNSNFFAIHHRSSANIFKSSIDDLLSKAKPTFFQKDIREWQKLQLQNFINFCNEIKSKMNVRHSHNIKEFLKFVKDTNNLFNQSNLNRYQEKLLINIIERGEIDIMDTPENMKIVKDFVFIDGAPYFELALQRDDLYLVERLINLGANTDFLGYSNISTLHYAVTLNLKNSIKVLIETGANIDVVCDGMSILHYSIYSEIIDVIRLLIEAGADVNIKSFNKTALEAAKIMNNFEASLELLKAGAMLSEVKSKGYILDSIDKSMLFVATILSKVISNKHGIDIIKIAEEEMLFAKDPIEYVLTRNDKVTSASNAMNNLILHENLVEIQPHILEAKDCLSQLSDIVTGDLNILCGKNYFAQDQDEL